MENSFPKWIKDSCKGGMFDMKEKKDSWYKYNTIKIGITKNNLIIFLLLEKGYLLCLVLNRAEYPSNNIINPKVTIWKQKDEYKNNLAI